MPKRRNRTDLTPRERREQIVTILSRALVRMPGALQIPPESDGENLRRPSKKALIPSAKNGVM